MAGEPDGQRNGRSFEQVLRDIQQNNLAFKSPAELVILLAYSVNLYSAIRICVEAGIFRLLAASSSPVSARELALKLDGAGRDGGDDADSLDDREEYVVRMARAVSGLQLVDEVAPGVYEANDVTRTLAEPGYEAGFREILDTALGPSSALYHMNTWGRENGWKAPEVSTDGPYQRARGVVGTTTFQHFVDAEPGLLSNLSAFMKVIQKDRLNWSEWFPADVLFSTLDESKPHEAFMVDVGGGLGHDIAGMAARYPDKKMRLIVEDLPSVIVEARAESLDPRIELVEQDFFAENKVKGAKIYFMHKIMHDWPDKYCVTILRHLRDAMAPDSRIFINDVILLEQGNPLLFDAFDMCMFVQLSAKERSETMWARLVAMVGGLEIRRFWQAPDLRGEGIVEVALSATP